MMRRFSSTPLMSLRANVAVYVTPFLTPPFTVTRAPIALRFDRGNGQVTSSKVLGDTRSVTVGVAPGTAALDLFPGKSQELAVRPSNQETVASQAIPAGSTTPKLGRQSILPTVEDLQ